MHCNVHSVLWTSVVASWTPTWDMTTEIRGRCHHPPTVVELDVSRRVMEIDTGHDDQDSRLLSQSTTSC